MKKSFSLLTTLLLVVLFSFLSVKIIQNQTFSTQVDKLKYLELQGKVHLEKIKTFIQNDSIKNFVLNDDRYELNYSFEGNLTHIYIKAKNEPVTIYESF